MAEETFGRLVARLRGERHMTQAELAARLYVTDKAVSKWERGVACPEISTLPRLADALGVRACELLFAIDPRGAAAPEDEAYTLAPACRNAGQKRRAALRYAGKALLLAAIAVLTVTNLYEGYVFDWLAGNTMTFSYPYFVLLILRHLFASCALMCTALLALGRGRARWAPIAAAGFAAFSALCSAGAADGWIMTFPDQASWCDWLGAAAHTLAAALAIAALPLRRRVLPAARLFLCAAGLCAAVALFVGVVNTPDFEPGELLAPALVRALELGAPPLLLAACFPAGAGPTELRPAGKP